MKEDNAKKKEKNGERRKLVQNQKREKGKNKKCTKIQFEVKRVSEHPQAKVVLHLNRQQLSPMEISFFLKLKDFGSLFKKKLRKKKERKS